MTTWPAGDGPHDTVVSTNGHHVPDHEGAPLPDLPADLEWKESYDRETLERFAAVIVAEKARLTSQIDEARRRIEVARAAASAGDAADLLRIARQELDEIEREHKEIIAVVRATAEAEAARILVEATREAESLRALRLPEAQVDR